MKKQKLRIGLTSLSALVLLNACKRDIARPEGDAPQTEVRAVAARLNFSSGTPKDYSVSLPSIITSIGGPGSTAGLNGPTSVASDGGSLIWIAEANLNRIRLVVATTGFTLVTYGSTLGAAGYQDGDAATAAFNHPTDIALGPDGVLYIADQFNHRIRTIDLSKPHPVGTFAGSGIAGFADGTPAVCKFNQPYGVAVDANGTVYVADEGNNMIRRIINKNSVTRWAGQVTPGSQDGPGAAASFRSPRGIAVSPTGAVYVADPNDNKIRKIVSGVVSTFAGDGLMGFKDGTGTAASFFRPIGVATDSAGNVYVTDNGNFAIRRITPDGSVTTLAGGSMGGRDGIGSTAQFRNAKGITVDPKGNIFISDEVNVSIRMLNFLPAEKTVLTQPPGITPSDAIAVGPDGSIYANPQSGTITKYDPRTLATTVFATGFSGSTRMTFDNAGNLIAIKGQQVIRISPSGATAVLATVDCQVNNPSFDGAGDLYLTAFGKHEELRKITPGGVVTTIKAQGPSVNDYTNSSIGWLYNPGPTWTQLAADKSTGNLYVGTGKAIYRMAPDGSNLTLIYGGPAANLPATDLGSPVLDPVTRAPLTTSRIWQDKTFFSFSNIMCTPDGKLYAANSGFNFGFSPANTTVRNNFFSIVPSATPGAQGRLQPLLTTPLGETRSADLDGVVDAATTGLPFSAVLSADNKTIYAVTPFPGVPAVNIRVISPRF